jgi:hypothetical protein
MLSTLVLAGFLRLRALFKCCMKTRAEHADYDPLMAIPQRPSSTSRRHAAASCERNFRCVRQHAPPSFGALDRPVQSHELAHDPAARSWPRPRARGARHLWTLLRRARTPDPDRSDTDYGVRLLTSLITSQLCLCVKGCCHLPYNSGFSVSRSLEV